MAYLTPTEVENAVLTGFQEGLSTGLGLIPVAGPFVQVIFGHIWDLAMADRQAEQKVAAMNSLYGAVGKMINKALESNIADQASAYNASISQLGQDYRVSVQSFKEAGGSGTSAQKVVVRFENCKSTLVHMLNLYGQPTYMHLTVLSYGAALSMYVSLLREMSLAGSSCGYSKSEIMDFQEDVNERTKTAYTKVMFEALVKLVQEGGEFNYPKVGDAAKDLASLVGGTMNLNTEWHDGKPCLLAKDHPDFADCDAVDNKAYYQLTFRRTLRGNRPSYYSMPQIFMNKRPALHVYENVDTELVISKFTPDKDMEVKLRAYYLVDYKDYDSSDVEVTVSTYSNPKVQQFHLNKRQRAVVSFPWVRMYYLSMDGGPWSTHFDKFSKEFRMHYDEYPSFKAQERQVYTIKTKAGSSATKNYYIIGFEVVPTQGVPNLLDSLFNAVEKTAEAAVAGVSNVVGGAVSGIGGFLGRK